MSKLDQLYRKLLLTRFFTKGWGKPDNLKRIFDLKETFTNREKCRHVVPSNYPVHIDKEDTHNGCRIIEGYFESPFNRILPGIMPQETITARFQMILPVKWHGDLRPVVLQHAGTGDHFYWRRRSMIARPLLKECGIASILLETPYYGLRKPKAQLRSCLHNVSDLFVMGGCLITESIALFNWCESHGYGPLGLTGISMGGHMASISASNWHKPLSLIPCLSWSTASSVFTQGVMSGAIPWKLLEQQYMSMDVYRNDIQKSVRTYNESLAFTIGQDFVKNFPESMTKVELLQKEIGNEKQRHNNNSIFNRLSLRNSSPTMNPDVVHFMCGMMDECTHVGNYSVPVDPELIIVVAAENDAYIPRDKIANLEELWPGVEVRTLKYGHISSFLFQQQVFRKAIRDSFQRQINKYYSESIEAKTGLRGYSKTSKYKHRAEIRPQRQSTA